MPLHSAVITRGFIALLSVALLSACDNAAQWAYQNGLEFEISRAGLQEETITTDDGIQWHLLVSESSTSAPPVLLIHGFGADASNWVRFAGNLEEEFYFVVPDLPGHGDSTRDLGLDYTMKAQAKRLLTLMDTLQIEQFHVAGNSMGGAITLEMARQAPQRVLSMGLVDSAGLTRQTPEFIIHSQQPVFLAPHNQRGLIQCRKDLTVLQIHARVGAQLTENIFSDYGIFRFALPHNIHEKIRHVGWLFHGP